VTARTVMPLTRAALEQRDGGPGAPEVRIVHMGLGAFHRAHQAWYTDRVDDRGEWGIAAFTGRSPAAARGLHEQDGLYSVVERSPEGDRARVVRSIVEAWDGGELDRFLDHLASSRTALVTLTITEAGYRLLPSGSPDLEDPVVRSDLGALSGGWAADAHPAVESSLARLTLGLEGRRRANGGPIAIVPCDNVPANGAFLRAGLLAMAASVGTELVRWIESNVSFVSTSVDRITPRTTPSDIDAVADLTGWADRSPVITEPFTDWILMGEFPAGRPPWENAGARFVADVDPFERRKLWLLNGAHTLLALAGPSRGHRTVAEAIADPVCRGFVEAWWDEAERHLPGDALGIPEYRQSLLRRFGNARIEHDLGQILPGSETKLRFRIVPVVLAERAAGRQGSAGARAIAAWVLQERSGGDPRPVIATLSPQLAEDDDFVSLVRTLANSLAAV
jgi:fructuronate reductase